MTLLYSIIESPAHPNFSRLYGQLGIREQKFNSIRKAIGQLKKQVPDVIVAEFFYGYGNNYAGVNVSNLDVLLASLQKYASHTRVILLVAKDEAEYVSKLAALFKVDEVLIHPVSEQAMQSALENASENQD